MLLRFIYLSIAVAILSTASAQRYTAKVIDGLPGAQGTYAGKVNSRGQVIGYCRFPSGYYRAFIWQNGQATDLGDLGGNNTFPRGLNEHGAVVGYSDDANNDMQAFVWTADKGMRKLFPEASRSIAEDINDHGVIVGSLAGRAFSLDGGRLTLLPAPYPNGPSSARIINNQGVIAGTNSNSEWPIAVRWIGGEFQILPGGLAMWPADINESAQIAGYHFAFHSHTEYPVTWLGNSVFHLPSLVGVGKSLAINESGDMVGYVLDRNWQMHVATIWRNNQMTVLLPLLDTVGWTSLWQAQGIDRYGRITGFGVYKERVRGFLLTPTGTSRR